MTNDFLNDLMRSIKHAPSVDVWQHVIAYAVEGRFDELIERLGGIESLVDSAIVNSTDPTAAKLTLDRALELFVTAWQPFLPVTYAATERMLRLISSRTPPSGFIKVLGQLSDRGGFLVPDEMSQRELKYIDDLALTALRSYFPENPTDPSAFPAFDSYIKLLWSRLDSEGHRGHACQRLMELGRLNLDDRRVEELLKTFSDETIPSLISWLLNTRRPERDHLLSHVYLLARANPSAADLFRISVSRQGARLEETSRSARIILRSNESIGLWLEIQDLELASLINEWETYPEQGRAVVETIAREN